jgi:hypothetical protein
MGVAISGLMLMWQVVRLLISFDKKVHDFGTIVEGEQGGMLF